MVSRAPSLWLLGGLLAVVHVAPIHAQDSAASRRSVVRGQAFDSLTGAPLAGARVWLWGSDRFTVADEEGRFRIYSVPPGTHLIVLEHETVDSAGFPTVGVRVAVRGGDTVDVTLATPSFETAWRGVCAGQAVVGRDSGIVFGAVRDAGSGNLLAGAAVTIRWLGFERAGPGQVVVIDTSMSTSTDDRGRYRLCGPFAGVVLRVQASGDGGATGVIPVSLVGRPMGRADLLLARPVRTASGARSGDGALRGTVRSDEGGLAVRAQVVVDGADSTFTDSEGGFLLSGLAAGTRLVRVRAIGFAPFQQAVDLRPRDTVALTLELRSVTVLDTVHVIASAPLSRRLEDLLRRRRLGGGHVLTEGDIKHRASIRSVFAGIPSLRVTSRSATSFALMVQAGRGWCAPSVYLDGTRSSVDELVTYRPADIAGIEVYPREAAAPGEYQRLGEGCGVVLVWTKYLR
jgi:hypothetical protein